VVAAVVVLIGIVLPLTALLDSEVLGFDTKYDDARVTAVTPTTEPCGASRRLYYLDLVHVDYGEGQGTFEACRRQHSTPAYRVGQQVTVWTRPGGTDLQTQAPWVKRMDIVLLLGLGVAGLLVLYPGLRHRVFGSGGTRERG
jgi:hypothetical protein